MTLTTHAVVGAVAASFFPEHPYAAFAAGFVSHFAIDVLPHWDYTLTSVERHSDPLKTDLRIGRKFLRDLGFMVADALLGFVLTFFVAWFLRVPLWLALIGAGAGLYPDLLSFIYMKMRRLLPWLARAYEPVQRFHIFIQWWEWNDDNWRLGVGLQIFLAVVVLLVAKLFT